VDLSTDGLSIDGCESMYVSRRARVKLYARLSTQNVGC
jgi:hypothetical protein